MAPEFNMMEMMICVAARYLEDGKTVAVGTGAPCAAAMLAQKTSAPNLIILFEAGGVAPMLPQMPISVGDSRTFFRAVMAAGMTEMMTTCARGLVDYAFLGGAQIDKFGNINSTVVGDFYKPKVRFPGSGGANDFASLCWRTMIMTVHSKARFVAKPDFITSPGYLTGAGAREAAGLPADSGPYKIVTDLAVMGFDAATKAMQVESLHPGVELDKVKAETGFELLVPARIERTEPPTAVELRTLREDVDPLKLVIGRA
jgi:glutaconate CoA-transferase subunit B